MKPLIFMFIVGCSAVPGKRTETVPQNEKVESRQDLTEVTQVFDTLATVSSLADQKSPSSIALTADAAGEAVFDGNDLELLAHLMTEVGVAQIDVSSERGTYTATYESLPGYRMSGKKARIYLAISGPVGKSVEKLKQMEVELVITIENRTNRFTLMNQEINSSGGIDSRMVRVDFEQIGSFFRLLSELNIRKDRETVQGVIEVSYQEDRATFKAQDFSWTNPKYRAQANRFSIGLNIKTGELYELDIALQAFSVRDNSKLGELLASFGTENSKLDSIGFTFSN